MLLSSDRRRCRQSVQTRCSFLQGSRCRTPSEDRQSRHPSSLFLALGVCFFAHCDSGRLAARHEVFEVGELTGCPPPVIGPELRLSSISASDTDGGDQSPVMDQTEEQQHANSVRESSTKSSPTNRNNTAYGIPPNSSEYNPNTSKPNVDQVFGERTSAFVTRQTFGEHPRPTPQTACPR